MSVAVREATAAPYVIDPNELLWSARILSGLVRVHRNVVPAKSIESQSHGLSSASRMLLRARHDYAAFALARYHGLNETCGDRPHIAVRNAQAV
jgi:hypothetical protein